MDIKEPEIKKSPVVDYNFVLTGGIALNISVWPTLGDKVTRTGNTWVFEFPTRRTTQEVSGVLTHVVIEGERIDPDTAMALVKKQRELLKYEADERKAKAAQDR